jgi:hypothetical protein
MRRFITRAPREVAVLLAVSAALVLLAPAAGASSPQLNFGDTHITPVRGLNIDAGGQLLYHGGNVMKKTSINYAIFWEPPLLQTGAPTHVSPNYNSLIQRYFGDVGGSGLYKNNTQYYQGNHKFIKNKSSLGDSYVDTSAYPASGCNDPATPGNCLSDAQIRAEVKKVIALKGWKAKITNMFYVFTSYGEGSCLQGTICAFTFYCAYHGHFPSGGDVIYANMPYTGTDLNGCGTDTSPNNDFDADSTINVTSHEHIEAVTDPDLNAWYDSSGAEIGDKCAWNFGPLNFDNGKANQSWNGHFYILQQEWSNAAPGCVQFGP